MCTVLVLIGGKAVRRWLVIVPPPTRLDQQGEIFKHFYENLIVVYCRIFPEENF